MTSHLLVEPIYNINLFIDPYGQLYDIKDNQYVKRDGIPPLREVIVDNVTGSEAGLTCDHSLIMLDNIDIPVKQNIRSFSCSVVNNQPYIAMLLTDGTLIEMGSPGRPVMHPDNADILIPVIQGDNCNASIVFNGVYHFYHQELWIPGNDYPKLDDIKVIRNGVITTNDGQLFQVDCVNRTMITHLIPFEVMDAITYRTGIMAIDYDYQLWLYQNEKWRVINNTQLESIGIKRLIACYHNKYEETYNQLHFIGMNGLLYELTVEPDITRIGERNVPYELINPVNMKKTKRIAQL